jgi:hypothetical protein
VSSAAESIGQDKGIRDFAEMNAERIGISASIICARQKRPRLQCRRIFRGEFDHMSLPAIKDDDD